MTAVLTATGVEKSFGPERTVLDGIDIALLPGQLTVVHGARDAGRSTLLRCLTGGYRPDAGHVVLERAAGSVDLAAADPRTLAWVRKHHIRDFAGPLAAPPSQDAASAAARSAALERETAVAGLRRLGVAELAEVPLGRLRRTARRAVALTAALLSQAAVVVLDEPDTAADPERVLDWISELRAGGTAVLAAPSDAHPFIARASASAILTEGKIQWTTQ
ncbi:hypothetical protein GCM10022261_08210 [Brevibacterium daeguense]|uniref:ABC transporter domain-containing protein n=1 Tax=Brevibacterium daeguense TaxID=909936 RepID=A0ABP8EHE4_9MICO|nr:ATP-binding cassette domain-containing protein [Brevibacterium daeguense]